MSALFPKRIELDDASIQQLQQLFGSTSTDLRGYLFTLNGKRLNRAQVAIVQQQVNARLQQLGGDVGAWVNTQVPMQYVQGQIDAARQQASFGNKKGAGLILGAIAAGMYAKYANDKAMTTAKIITPPAQVFDLQNQAIDAIKEDMATSFGNSLTYMSRSTDGVIRRVQSLGIRQAIAEGASKGESTDAITKQITDLIHNADIDALVDKAGRKWTPENYADMLVKTKLTEARNNGLMNSLLSIGQDLVEVSAHAATDACKNWEGRILSISGRSELYPSVAEATAGGLFHPRCQHVLNAVPRNTYPEQSFDPEAESLSIAVAA